MACFGARPTTEYFDWKYLKNPCGPLVAYEAWSNGGLAAFYGVLPAELEENGKVIRCYQSLDTMTHPAFQRRGLFSATAKATYDCIERKEGVARLYGIGGSKSLPGLLKLGWTQLRTRDLTFQHASVLKRLGPGTGEQRYLEVGDEALFRDYFAAREPIPGLLRLHLSWDFFSWRVLRHPRVTYRVLGHFENGKLEGLAVTRQLSSNRTLIFLLDSRRADTRAVSAKALTRAIGRELETGWLYAWEPADPLLLDALRSSAFLKNPFRKGPFSHRVPVVLHQQGGDPGWVRSRLDWQPLIQD